MLRRIFPSSRTEDRRLTFERKRFRSDLLIFPVAYSAEMWEKNDFFIFKVFLITNSTQYVGTTPLRQQYAKDIPKNGLLKRNRLLIKIIYVIQLKKKKKSTIKFQDS